MKNDSPFIVKWSEDSGDKHLSWWVVSARPNSYYGEVTDHLRRLQLGLDGLFADGDLATVEQLIKEIRRICGQPAKTCNGNRYGLLALGPRTKPEIMFRYSTNSEPTDRVPACFLENCRDPGENMLNQNWIRLSPRECGRSKLHATIFTLDAADAADAARPAYGPCGKVRWCGWYFAGLLAVLIALANVAEPMKVVFFLGIISLYISAASYFGRRRVSASPLAGRQDIGTFAVHSTVATNRSIRGWCGRPGMH